MGRMRSWLLLRFLHVVVICAAGEVHTGMFASFFAWLAEHGAEFGVEVDIGMDSMTELRGLVVKGPVAKGMAVFTIPSQLIVTLSIVQEKGAFWQQCRRDGKDSLNIMSTVHASFALFLLEQRAIGSPWQPWVASLPKDFNGFPLFYSPEDLEGLQASPLRRVFDMEVGTLNKDYATLADKGLTFTLAEYKWAKAAVRSRVFDLSRLPAGNFENPVIAMVPLADFVNHPPDGVKENVIAVYNVSTGRFYFEALRDISPGEALYWNYGFKSNRHSLSTYGFVAKGSISSTDMPLFFRLTEFPGVQGNAKEWKLKQMEVAETQGSLVVDPDGSVLHEFALALQGRDAERLLGHMRFMVWRPRTPELLAEYCGNTYCKPITLATEREALRHLAKLLQRMLESYSTSVTDDKELLEGGIMPSSGAPWQTLVIRYGEKQILHGFLRVLQALDPLFDLSPWALSKSIDERWNNNRSDIHNYVREDLRRLLELETVRWAKRKVKEEKAMAN